MTATGHAITAARTLPSGAAAPTKDVMRHALPALFLAAAAALAAPAAEAACYADYKARQDNPLRLHYGVMEVPDGACSVGAAAEVVAARLGDGWRLLQVVGVFGPEGLESRRASAGAYFLRY